MPGLSTGDLALQFASQNRILQTKSRLFTLQSELATGRKADIALDLGANAATLAHLEHRTGVIRSHLNANRETADMLTQMQLTLSIMESRRADLTDHVLSLPMSISDQQREGFAGAARLTFEAMINDLKESLKNLPVSA